MIRERISHSLESDKVYEGKLIVAAIKSVAGDSILAEISRQDNHLGIGLREGVALYIRTKNLVSENPKRATTARPKASGS